MSTRPWSEIKAERVERDFDIPRVGDGRVNRLSHETSAYAAYLNRSYSPFDDPDEQALFDEDLLKARAAMEVAWLEMKAAIIKP